MAPIRRRGSENLYNAPAMGSRICAARWEIGFDEGVIVIFTQAGMGSWNFVKGKVSRSKAVGGANKAPGPLGIFDCGAVGRFFWENRSGPIGGFIIGYNG